MSWQRGLRPAPPPLNPEDDDDYFRGYGSMGRHYGQYGSWGRHRTPNYHNMTQRDGECHAGHLGRRAARVHWQTASELGKKMKAFWNGFVLGRNACKENSSSVIQSP